MTRSHKGIKKKRVAWGITGSGDKLQETVQVMTEIRRLYEDEVDIRVYLSKAGEQVVKFYHLVNEIEDNFDRVSVEINPNLPFLAGQLQLSKFEYLLIAPATSNTVAKISMSIGDSLLTNAAIMALKAFVPVYILPSDYREGMIVTRLPNGRDHELRVRRADADHVKKLATMDDVFILKEPTDIFRVFKEHFARKTRVWGISVPEDLYTTLQLIAEREDVTPEEMGLRIIQEKLAELANDHPEEEIDSVENETLNKKG